MKKVLIMIAYWIAAMLVTAQILVSLDYDLRQATMMSLAFLPSALALSFFLPKVDLSDSRRIWDFPSMLRNPFFIAAILALLAYGHYLLEKWLEKRFPSTYPITFNSEHRKISLKKDDILYVESRDSEVWIVARDGQTYRNRNGITQWENLLGDGFLRIHRAFLVNVAESDLSSPDTVHVGETQLPVSRKYKENVKVVLASSQAKGPEPPASNKNP